MTTFADVNDEYQHLICVPTGEGLCGQYQQEIVWFSIPCSACLLIHELQPPNTCALRGGPCDCFTVQPV
jgi:hypothetical protein